MQTRLLAAAAATLALVSLSACQGASQTTAPASGSTTAAGQATTGAATTGTTTKAASKGEPTDAKSFLERTAEAVKAEKTTTMVSKTEVKAGDVDMSSTTTTISDVSDPNNEKSKSETKYPANPSYDTTTIVIGNTVYTKMGSGKFKRSTLSADDIAKAGSAASGVPTAGTGGSLTKVGAEKVDGVDTTHWTVGVMDGMSMEMWVDSKYRPLKTQVSSGGKVVSTTAYSDYGKAVDIQAPPADQIEG